VNRSCRKAWQEAGDLGMGRCFWAFPSMPGSPS